MWVVRIFEYKNWCLKYTYCLFNRTIESYRTFFTRHVHRRRATSCVGAFLPSSTLPRPGGAARRECGNLKYSFSLRTSKQRMELFACSPTQMPCTACHCVSESYSNVFVLVGVDVDFGFLLSEQKNAVGSIPKQHSKYWRKFPPICRPTRFRNKIPSYSIMSSYRCHLIHILFLIPIIIIYGSFVKLTSISQIKIGCYRLFFQLIYGLHKNLSLENSSKENRTRVPNY